MCYRQHIKGYVQFPQQNSTHLTTHGTLDPKAIRHIVRMAWNSDLPPDTINNSQEHLHSYAHGFMCIAKHMH